jgi:hypothetical protein
MKKCTDLKGAHNGEVCVVECINLKGTCPIECINLKGKCVVVCVNLKDA